MKILIICPYFGSLPQHFPFFLKSCEYNSNINWLIYTDDTKYNYATPENVEIKNVTFEEMRSKIQNKFNFEISLDKPYKLCDFRVAFGDIFEDDISNYDFWGHCDFDVIFGDINKFVTDDLLNKYYKLFIYGCLSIYKNDNKVNKAYIYNLVDNKNDIYISYRDIFSSSEAWHFDEVNGIFDIHIILNELKLPYYDISEPFADVEMKSKRLLLTKDRVFEWENGKLYDKFILDGRFSCCEYGLLHFSGRSFTYDEKPNSLTQSFIITSDSIMTKYSQLDVKNIIKYSEILDGHDLKQLIYTNPNITFKRMWKQYVRLKKKEGI